MDQNRPPPRWRAAIGRVPLLIRIVGGLALTLVLILLVVRYSRATDTTLWDWLKLLIVPAVIAGVGVWFNWTQKARELNIARSRAQDEALEAYMDQMSQLLADKERPVQRAQLGDRLSTVARARTLTALPRLDSGRKRRVLQFLYESGLIHKKGTVLSLFEADLQEADLQRANLRGAFLQGAFLDGADLRGARKLTQAQISGAHGDEKTQLPEGLVEDLVHPEQ